MYKRRVNNSKKQLGAAAVEYMGLVGGIGLAVMGAATGLGDKIDLKLNDLGSQIETIGTTP